MDSPLPPYPRWPWVTHLRFPRRFVGWYPSYRETTFLKRSGFTVISTQNFLGPSLISPLIESHGVLLSSKLWLNRFINEFSEVNRDSHLPTRLWCLFLRTRTQLVTFVGFRYLQGNLTSDSGRLVNIDQS